MYLYICIKREKQGVEEVDRADVWQHGRMRGESYVDENTRKMGEKIMSISVMHYVYSLCIVKWLLDIPLFDLC